MSEKSAITTGFVALFRRLRKTLKRGQGTPPPETLFAGSKVARTGLRLHGRSPVLDVDFHELSRVVGPQ
jgi:hypothetical protein